MIGTLFDKYSIRARIYPALIVALPIMAMAVLALPGAPWTAMLSLALGSGILFLLATIVRTLGRNLERRLTLRWNGMPTTQMLRHSGATNSKILAKRRLALEAIVGVALPSAQFETSDPVAADEEYVAATRDFIQIVRQNHTKFPRVQDENINYGFLRNLLSLKPAALTVLLACYFIDFLVGATFGSSFALIASLCTNVALTLAWLFYVRPGRVLEAAQIYASRLFECLSTPGAFGQNARDSAQHRA